MAQKNTVEFDGARREVLKIAGATLAGCCAISMDGARAEDAAAPGIVKGDLLVPAKGAETAPLKVDDIKVGAKPVLVFPFDLTEKKPRNESRLNKLLLVRMEMADMSDELKARSANGVLAFSSVCTHQACDVTEWIAAEKNLMCFCHFSKFSPLEGGAVAKGPAGKSLPWVPLIEKDGLLIVAGGFSVKPGV